MIYHPLPAEWGMQGVAKKGDIRYPGVPPRDKSIVRHHTSGSCFLPLPHLYKNALFFHITGRFLLPQYGGRLNLNPYRRVLTSMVPVGDTPMTDIVP